MGTWTKIIGLIYLYVFGFQLVGFFVVSVSTDLIGLSMVDAILVADLVNILIIFLFVRWRKKHLQNQHRIGFGRPKISVLLLSIPLAISLNFFYRFFMELLPLAEEGRTIEEIFSLFFTAPLWQGVLSFAVFAALIEEIIFRGLVYHELRRKMSVVGAVIVQGVLFGAVHGNLYQFIYVALIGILLGFIYVWTRSIWVVMLIHFISNFVHLLTDKYTLFKPFGSVLYAAVSLLIAIGLMIWIYCLEKRSPSPRSSQLDGKV